ncbi:MAG TPA: sugar nucleotide-binding protein [Thermoplasmata archaeon]|nr:sugar nucleotide-binding protein [Thermoplasmata archaeon]
MTKLLVFGSDSLVGSHFVEHTRHSVFAAGRRDPVERGLKVEAFQRTDLTDLGSIDATVRSSPADGVINFAAATEVDHVERERAAEPSRATGPAYELNALAPRAMALAARASGKRFLTISTDFVFDGMDGPYDEAALPSAWSPRVGWYGWTKGEGERQVREADPEAVILRIAYPYRSHFTAKSDFARGLIQRYRSGTLPPMFGDQQITPTWIPDVSRALETLADSRATGTFHASSPESTTPWEFARELLTKATGTTVLPARGSMAGFLERPGTTPRPLRGGLRVGRLPALGVPLTGWKHGITAFVAEGGGA